MMKTVRVMGMGLGLVVCAGAVQSQDVRPKPRPAQGEGMVSAMSAPVVVAVSRSPVARPADLMQGRQLREALGMARQGGWDGALSVAADQGQVAADIIEWQRLRSGDGSFAEYRAFLARNADWPGLDLLRKRGEAAIGPDADAVDVIAYFDGGGTADRNRRAAAGRGAEERSGTAT